MPRELTPIGNVSFAQVEVTTRCNFTCGFCSGRHMPQTDIDHELFLATLERLPGLEHLELQGEGEPLLHPRFFDMLETAKQRGINTYFITNGSLFNPEAIQRILRAQVSYIAVSIESADAQTFQRIRGGKLQKVLDGVSQLLSERRKLGLERPVVGFAVTVMRSTLGSFERILELYEELGMDGGISVQPLQRMSQYTRYYTQAIQRELLDETEDLAATTRALAAVAARKIEPRALGFYARLFRDWQPASRTCPWLDRGLYVGRDGTGVVCCMMKDPDRHNLGNIGSATESSILARRSELAAALAEGRTPDVCNGCVITKFIGQAAGEPNRKAAASKVRLPLA